jgi:biopolymer transport protein ExbB
MDRGSERWAAEPPSRRFPRSLVAHLVGCAIAVLVVMANAGLAQTRPMASSPETVSPPAGDRALSPGAEATSVPPGPVAPEPTPAAPLPESTLPRDLSPWGMFEAADKVVKAVMIGLAFASLVTWTIWLAKSLEFLAAGARLRRELRIVLAAGNLDEAERALRGGRGPMALMVRAARHETATAPAAIHHGDGRGLLQRVSSHLTRIEAQAARRLNFGIGVLATIGATAPFVGLFGTVWGIMNSFIGISESQTTNLAVVAPGIAEALLATALGLVAAIPAVVIYNLFARWIAGHRARLADASAAVERLVSRDLDHRRLVPSIAPRAAE